MKIVINDGVELRQLKNMNETEERNTLTAARIIIRRISETDETPSAKRQDLLGACLQLAGDSK